MAINYFFAFYLMLYYGILKGFGNRMLNKLLKSLLVICGTVFFTAFFGIIFFGKAFEAMLPESFTGHVYPGLAVTAAGVLLSLASAFVILKYFIFFTRTRVIDSEGNVLTDNNRLTLGSKRIHPIFFAVGGILIGMVVIGLGFGIMLDSVTMYVVRLFTIAAVLLLIAGTIFLFSIIRHKIRRRFAWIASGILGFIALAVITATIPALSDLSVRESDLTPLTATVVQTSSYTGFLTGPGKSVIRVKGTSGERLTLRFNGSRGSFKVGKKYTFYYLPHTHLIKKVSPADNIQY